MFTRTWNGTHDVCYERDVNGGYAQILDSKDMSCDATMIPSIDPIEMIAINGAITCGKRGGTTFVE